MYMKDNKAERKLMHWLTDEKLHFMAYHNLAKLIKTLKIKRETKKEKQVNDWDLNPCNDKEMDNIPETNTLYLKSY